MKENLHKINSIEKSKREVITCLMFHLLLIEVLLTTQLDAIKKEPFYPCRVVYNFNSIILKHKLYDALENAEY